MSDIASSTGTVAPRDLAFEAADGTRLAGRLFAPQGEPRAAVLVSSGTGFPQTFYRHVAAHLATRGALALTFDCRGIAASAPNDLAAMDMDYPDWGRLDMPAALDALLEEAAKLGREGPAPSLPIGHLAHSVGGHFAGFMPNHARIARHAFVAVGSGYWRDHPLRYNPFELYFWHVLGPRSIRRHGYVRRGGGWTGTALPRGVFETWRRWCLTPGYYRDELRERLRPHHFDEVEAAIASWVFTDDPIAHAKTNRDIALCYPAAIHTQIVRRPADYGRKRIGHSGMFRPGFERLWDEWLDWLAPGLTSEDERPI